MGYLPQCWSQKAHDPHTWGHDEPDERAPFDCPGLKNGSRFIDKFTKIWGCFSPGSCQKWVTPCDPGEHANCGWRWSAALTDDDMKRLGRAFDMSRADIREFLGE